jgi:hypothetical protein
MATAIGSILSNELVINLTDEADEPGRLTLPLDGATSDADIIAIVDDYAALTNAVIEPVLVRRYPFTGYATAGKPAAALQSLIATMVALDFQKDNPVNAAKSISRQVPIYAYLNAIRNDAVKPHVPVTTNSTLNALIALLEANLNYLGADGILYPGGWTYNPASKFGTKLTVTDGF